MQASECVREIEHLDNANEVQFISLPAVELTEADYTAAADGLADISNHVTEASGERNMQSIVALYAVVQKREQQLTETLRSLAVTKADLNDSHDIIKRWRQHCGYTSDQDGEIHFSASQAVTA
jgi:hypothetical protein